MGEFITRATVWLAVGMYFAACSARICGDRVALARRLWSAGVVLFLIHVVCAFHFFYGWSHAVAWEETARQTEAMTGSRSGSGIYLNYLFAAVWVIDAGWWWLRGDAVHAGRSRWVNGAIHGFFLFMIVNGAVVFTTSPLRWVAAGLLVVLAAMWARKRGKGKGD